MSWVIRFLKSTVGAKTIVAITGLGLFGFVLQHMVANLAIFSGREAMNAYAYWIKHKPLILWGGRSAILAAFVAHVYFTVRLTARNRAARKVGYQRYKSLAERLFSRWMVLSGLLVLAFITYHLLHFTLGVTNPDHFSLVDPQGRHDVYSMFILGFQQVPVAVSYMIAMLLLGVHLSHGVSSLFQTLGLNSPKWKPLIRWVGPLFAAVIVIGNLSMPLAVLLGYLQLPPRVG